ncbi:tyrosine-type recombinase/integrase [Povalibacter sp.]|uniref:tyrosine-type recombinase/integrase n=1 Tax=Povalibacter sp. TaxID=1962978 RepID=UPI002F3F4018
MLTDTAIRSLKPGDRPRKVADGRGLYLLVTPTGSRLWRFKYRMHGIERVLALGQYPDVTLQSARARREKARQLVAEGIDPGALRKAEKAKLASTFKDVALAWLERQRKSFSEATIEKTQWMFESYLFPAFGVRPIATITAADLLHVLLKVEARGRNETAHRLRQRLGQIFRYSVVTNLREHDPTPALRGALAPVVTTHRAAITDPKEIGGLLRAIDSYSGQPTTRIALKLAPYVFARPIELRAAYWLEFELEGNKPEWRIPAERMKAQEEHIIPLSRQATALLRELQHLTTHSLYVFPAVANNRRPMSENTINAALRRLGYSKDEMTAHGFRSLASTMMNEMGWPPDLIELQLAHTEPNKVRAAYNGAKRLEDRRKMMQAWADHLDALRSQTPRSETEQSFSGDSLDTGPAYFE